MKYLAFVYQIDYRRIIVAHWPKDSVRLGTRNCAVVNKIDFQRKGLYDVRIRLGFFLHNRNVRQASFHISEVTRYNALNTEKIEKKYIRNHCIEQILQ